MSKKEYKGKLAISILQKIDMECNLRKSEFLILDIPLRVSRKEFVSTFPFEYANGDENFHIVSTIDKFKERNGEQIYWERGDGHFTPLGCNLVGDVLTGYIENHNLLGF